MKLKLTILIPLLLLVLMSNTLAQGTIGNLRDFVELKDKRYIPRYETVTIINGKNVRGVPFLYFEWQAGIIKTIAGREYDNYKIKYDSYHQTIHFYDGKDSLETDEQLRGFTIDTKQGDSIVKIKFLNAINVEAINKPKFYEVLFEDSCCYLLKLNKKVISKDAILNLPVSEDKEHFDLVFEYYYYNKVLKKMNRVSSNGANSFDFNNTGSDSLKKNKTNSIHFTSEWAMINRLKLICDYKRPF